MDVYINNNGNATVTETWDVNLSSGTEGYKTFSKLGNITISDFKVKDELGRKYNNVLNWNTNDSFNGKAYKCGIHYLNDGVELCWGISSYGDKIYYLTYKINGLVTQYKDNQGIYFNFLNIDQQVDNANIIIHSDIPFSMDNAKIWGFGYNGNINFINNTITMDTTKYLSDSQYMVTLIKFEEKLFNTSNKSNLYFNDVFLSANNTLAKAVPILSKVDILIIIAITLIFIIVFFVVLDLFNKHIKKNEINDQLNFGIGSFVIPEEVNYFREIPCNGNIERAYWICMHYNVIPPIFLRRGIIGAILLKWIKLKNVTVCKTEKGLFSIKDNNYAIDLSRMTSADNEIENDFLNILNQIAGSNKILEAHEFKKWSKKNYSIISNWFVSILNKEKTYLENQGLITSDKYNGSNSITKMVSSELKEEAIKLKGLKRYLLDFSRINEKAYYDVHLWEEYLIFAYLFGIADKVEEQFSKLSLDFKNKWECDFNFDVDEFINNFVDICYDCINYNDERTVISFDCHDNNNGGGGSSNSSGGSSAGGSSGGGFR